MNSTVDKTEVNHFDKPNQDWWDENGSFSALHRLTPCRIEYIVQVIKRNIIKKQINPSTRICNNLNILDVGCGGGLFSLDISFVAPFLSGYFG